MKDKVAKSTMHEGTVFTCQLDTHTVEPPKADTPKSGQPLKDGQVACPRLLIPLEKTSERRIPLTSGQRTRRASLSATPPYKATSKSGHAVWVWLLKKTVSAAQQRLFLHPLSRVSMNRARLSCIGNVTAKARGKTAQPVFPCLSTCYYVTIICGKVIRLRQQR